MIKQAIWQASQQLRSFTFNYFELTIWANDS